MSFLKGLIVAGSLALATASSANALVVMTPDGNYEFGGLQEPAWRARQSAPSQFYPGNATWSHDRSRAEMFTF
jgi:hypothetical protein